MAKKIRANILGRDINLLKNVAKRVAQDRPAEVKYFTEVKDFLVDSMQDKPDIVAVSVNYPHKNATKLPHIIRMALNIPVIMFGESQDNKTRKSISSANSDYKIPGIITAHNFWMKLVNFQKHMEEKEKEREEEKSRQEKAQSLDEISTEINTSNQYDILQDMNDDENVITINQGDFERILDQQDEGSIIDSLFAQIDDQQKESGKKDKALSQGQVSTNVTSAGMGKEFDSDESSIHNLSGQTNVGGDVDGSHLEDIASTIENSEDSPFANLTNSNNTNMMSEVDSSSNVSDTNPSFTGNENTGANIITGLGPEASTQQSGSLESSLEASLSPNNDQSDSLGLHTGNSQSTSPLNEGSVDKSKKANTNDASFDNSKNSPMAQSKEEKKKKQKETKPPLAKAKDKKASAEEKSQGDAKNKKNTNAPATDEKGRVQLSNSDDIKKRERAKQKARDEKEIAKQQDLLKESCEEAIKKVLFTSTMENPRSFEADKVCVFTIEFDKFKGFILVTDSFNNTLEDFMLEEFRNNIVDLLKSKGYVADLSSSYFITIPRSDYPGIVEQACEFTIYEEEETGRQIVISFLRREVTQPQYEDSDKEGMITVDMKTIPPQTPVNFDAFIYLPRNKKFVRYLKEGRSLSLKQVKRHIQGDEPCKLYLPKSEKGKLIQFFIQNTIRWEFISFSEGEKESA